MTQKKQRKKKKKIFFSPKFFFLTLKILEILKIPKFALKILDFWPFLGVFSPFYAFFGGYFQSKKLSKSKKKFSEKEKFFSSFFFSFRLRTGPPIYFGRHTPPYVLR